MSVLRNYTSVKCFYLITKLRETKHLEYYNNLKIISSNAPTFKIRAKEI